MTLNPSRQVEAMRADMLRQLPQQPFKAIIKDINPVAGQVQLQIAGSASWQWFRCLENIGLDEASVGQEAVLAFFGGEPIVVGLLQVGGKQYNVPPHSHADDAEGSQLDWDDVWEDAVHSHANNAEGGDLFATTHVAATTAAGQNIPNIAWTVVIFGTEVRDALAEYNPATGVFTALYAGDYHVHAAILYSATATWAATETAELAIYVDGVWLYELAREIDHTAANINVSATGGATVYLTAGQTLDVRAYQSSGGALTLFANALYNWLTIDRIR